MNAVSEIMTESDGDIHLKSREMLSDGNSPNAGRASLVKNSRPYKAVESERSRLNMYVSPYSAFSLTTKGS